MRGQRGCAPPSLTDAHRRQEMRQENSEETRSESTT